ncbi:MAG: hypothetical protein IT460_11120 [Planctomycetes bacterium]|nr:hypothetical protein [Planctomycetota bacterium]
MRRSILPALGLSLLGWTAGLSARTASADPCSASSRHPFFDDQGTLAWSTTLDGAVASARASGRLVFIEYGRRECRNCKILVQKILPALGVRERASAACVGLAADCDEPDPRVQAIFQAAMPDASLLPFVAIVTPDLRWVTGWQGGIGADEVVRHLAKAEALRARPCAAPTRAAPPPAAATTAAPRGLAVGPTAPAAAAADDPAERTRAAALLARARDADTRGAHGEVLRLDAEAAKLPLRADPAAWAALVTRAAGWCDECLRAAVASARAGRCGDASKWLESVRAGAAGTPAATEAEAGERAVALVATLESASPTDRARGVAQARERYRGTRWSRLFE